MATSTQWQLDQGAAQRYERILVASILGPAARALVDCAALGDGESVLDVGCGTGAATRMAAGLVGAQARVVGVDINAGMLAVAQSLQPDGASAASIGWVERNAVDLASLGETFDVVLCAQTLQFLPEREEALTAMYGALKPGGRAVLSFWGGLESNPYFDALVRAMDRHVGAEAADGLRAAFRLPDASAVTAPMKAIGFRHVLTVSRRLDLALPPPDSFVPLHVSATPMAAAFSRADESARQAVVRDVQEQLASCKSRDGLKVPFRTHVVTGFR
ncbi:methyltransferase domain-containing protein [Hydrogenophaga sp. 5NK40-0174]|uniref:class I SAM-dependent methyltransferase n=1 Tax=Hydrogenophaga sp. 5NK40-0174 TaxID=3127649 RepID=UPI00310BA5EF